MLKVKHIENGTVIDHIEAGKGMKVFQLIGKVKGVVVIALNVDSSAMQKKDMLKLEDTYVSDEKLNLISLVAPEATINLIKDSEVSEKKKAALPKEINGVLKCPNPDCITNQPREPLATKFAVSKSPIRLTCGYCSKEFDETVVSTL